MAATKIMAKDRKFFLCWGDDLKPIQKKKDFVRFSPVLIGNR